MIPHEIEHHSVCVVGIALVASLANFVIEPMGTGILMERYALENASGPKDKEKIKSLKGQIWRVPWAQLTAELGGAHCNLLPRLLAVLSPRLCLSTS